MNATTVATVTTNGRTINWQLSSGRVMGLTKYSKTHVYGGGSVHNGEGTISIGSTAEVITEFLLRDHEGIESPYRFTDLENIVLRDGHRVTAVFGGANRSSWIALVNHDTKQWFIMQRPKDFIYATGLIKKISGWWILAAFPLGALLSGLLRAVPFGGLVILGPLGVIGALLIRLSVVHPVGGLVMFCPLGVIVAKIVQSVRATLAWENQVGPVLNDIAGKLLSSSDSLQ